MKKIQFILCFIGVLFFNNLQAQKTKTGATTFSTVNYTSEVAAFFEQDKTADKDKQMVYTNLLKEYTTLWSGMSPDMRTQIVNISSTIIKQKGKQQEIANFLQAQMVVRKNDKTFASFDEWLKCTSKMRKQKDFGAWFEFCKNLIENNMIYESKTSKWSFNSSATFKFKLQGSQPTIVFDKNFELYYGTDKETGTIFGTTGTFYYSDNKWVGNGGRVDWTRTGLSANECWATLHYYETNTKFPKFSADSVDFVNQKYFKQPIKGHFDDHISVQMDPDKYVFPKFRSYKKDFVMNDIVPNVDYRGSFMMNGNKFLTSDATSAASLIFHRENKPFLVVTSYKFTISPSQIYSEKANITIHLNQDSIINTGVSIRYNPNNKEVLILNNNKRNYYSPYTNTYHEFDMYCESIIWKIDADILDISMLRQQGTQSFSSFESSNYYSKAKYEEIQGIADISPLQKVFLYAKKEGMDEFYIDEFAIYLKMDLGQTKLMIHNLAKAGLVSFDEVAGRVYVKKKLKEYVKANSKAKNIDYDAINLVSATKNQSNATIDLKTLDMHMIGIEKFVVSDSQKVAIYPKDNQITVRKNRNILFDGYINAGKFEMIVSNGVFDYEAFKLDLPHIDTMWFSVTSFTEPPKWEKVKTPLNDLVGEILIDKPDNHASLKRYKEYPIFTSKEKCFVFYDNPAVKIKGYDPKRFYYTVQPFVIKSMLKFETDSLIFSGALTSAGIFPELNEPLRVQPDYSLGFVMETPQNGLPLYGGKGHYNKTIDLSYRGFLGQGQVDYLSSVSKSNDIVFLPDSMIAVTDTFYINEQLAGGTDFPDTKIGKATEHWHPYEDVMTIYQRSKKDPFMMYHNETRFDGFLTLQPKGLSGNGMASLLDAELVSDTFQMRRLEMSANKTSFKLKSQLFDDWAFYATNVKSNIDYKNRTGDFVSNEEINRVTLPMMNYAAYIDKFTWAMDDQELALKNSKSENTGGIEALDITDRIQRGLPGALYVATQADSLNFYATQGIYRYNKAQLSAKNVFLVYVADAAIAPAGDTLLVQAKGKMKKLEKSKIVADIENRYHLIYDANVEIVSRTNYTATGFVDYIDEDDKKQSVFLNAITTNAQGTTIGRGYISDSLNFKLSPAFRYMGNISLNAKEKDYLFEGGVQLIHNCITDGEELGFLSFKGNIDPKNIIIPISEIPVDSKNNRMTASILFDPTNIKPYSAFLTKDKAADNELLGASGFLTYDKIHKEYRIASREKLENMVEVAGNYLVLKTQTCDVEGEGPIDFGIKQDLVKTYSYGKMLVNNTKEDAEIDMLFGFNFPIDEKALNMMGQYIADDLGLAAIETENPLMHRALLSSMGEEKGEEVYSDYINTFTFDKIPEVFKYSLFFSNVKWKYLQGFGYYCNGTVSLVNVGNVQVNRLLKAKMQYVKRKSGTYLKIYLQVAKDHWYYFNYDISKHSMLIKSSFVEFDDLIRNAKDREFSKDGVKYHYRLVTNATEVARFLRSLDSFNENADNELIEEEEIPEDNE